MYKEFKKWFMDSGLPGSAIESAWVAWCAWYKFMEDDDE